MRKIFFGTLLLSPIWAVTPQDASIAAGQATFEVSGRVTTVTASDRSILHWKDFSIAPGETARFVLPGASAAVLNRVSGVSPSHLLGNLESNGQVFLINPHGIVTGKDAVINVGSFIASAFDVLDSDFLSQKELSFSGGEGEIVHQGVIHAATGDVFLIARAIRAEGEVTAPNGAISLIAAGEVVIQPQEYRHLFVRASKLSDPDHLFGDAQNLSVSPDALHLKQCALTGETILLAADDILLEDQTTLTADFSIRVGGDFQGKNEAVPHALRVEADSSVLLTANGGGATVVVWSDQATRFFGKIEAKGGPLSQDGGMVEVSSKGFLDYRGWTDTSAPYGKTGTLLLDPSTLSIIAGAAAPPVGGAFSGGNPDTFTPSAAVSSITTGTIVANLAAANVAISSGTALDGLGGTGDITIVDPIVNGNANGNALTITGYRHIFVNASVQSVSPSTGPISLLSTTGDIYIGNAAITAPVAVGTFNAPVSVIACVGDVVFRASDAIGTGYAIVGSHSGVSDGSLTVAAGRDILMQSGAMIESYTAITRMGIDQTATILDSDIFVTAGRDLLMRSNNVDECETFIGHGGKSFGAHPPRIGDTTVNVGRDLTMTSLWNPNVLTDTRVYIGSSANSDDFQSFIQINVGRNFTLQGEASAGNPGHHSYVGTGGSLNPANYRMSAHINVGGDFLANSIDCILTGFQVANDGAIASIPPELFLHVNGNIVFLGGNPVPGFQPGTVAANRIFNAPGNLFTTHMWARGNIVCINGSTGNADLHLPAGLSAGNITTMIARAGGDIRLASGLNGVISYFSNGGISYQADYGFAPGDLWAPQSASVCGGPNIFAATPLGAASISTVSNNLGAFSIDTGTYNNALFNPATLTSPQIAPGTTNHIFRGQGGADVLIESGSQFANGSPADFFLGTGPNQAVINNTLSAAPYTAPGGDITIVGYRDTYVSNSSLSAPAGDVLVVTDRNMQLASAVIVASGSVTLVVDEQFPVSPGIGNGFFSIDGASSITSLAEQIAIYTATQDLNLFDPNALFNGTAFSVIFPEYPGTLFTDTDREVWCTYYQQGNSTPVAPFTIFYKNCPQQIIPVAAVVVSELLFALNAPDSWYEWEYPFLPPDNWRFRIVSELPVPQQWQERYWIERQRLHMIHTPYFFGRAALSY